MNTDKIDESTVRCPNDRNKIIIMTTWGKKKRERYAHLVKIDMYTTDKAFDIVEYNKGKVK